MPREAPSICLQTAPRYEVTPFRMSTVHAVHPPAIRAMKRCPQNMTFRKLRINTYVQKACTYRAARNIGHSRDRPDDGARALVARMCAAHSLSDSPAGCCNIESEKFPLSASKPDPRIARHGSMSRHAGPGSKLPSNSNACGPRKHDRHALPKPASQRPAKGELLRLGKTPPNKTAAS